MVMMAVAQSSQSTLYSILVNNEYKVLFEQSTKYSILVKFKYKVLCILWHNVMIILLCSESDFLVLRLSMMILEWLLLKV